MQVPIFSPYPTPGATPGLKSIAKALGRVCNRLSSCESIQAVNGKRSSSSQTCSNPACRRGQLNWAALGHTLYQAARFGDSGNSAALLERVEQISQQLLEHDNSQANGYALQSNLRQLEGQHEPALTAARRAVELAPDSPDHRGRLALVLLYGGEAGEALKQFGITTQLSLHYPNWLTVIPIMAHYFLGDLEKAREAAEQSLADFSDYPYAYVNLAGIYSALGLHAKAQDMASCLLRLQPTFSLADYRKAQLFINREDTDAWIGHLSKAGFPD